MLKKLVKYGYLKNVLSVHFVIFAEFVQRCVYVKLVNLIKFLNIFVR